MSSLPPSRDAIIGAYAVRLIDLFDEASEELGEGFGDLLVIAATLISRRVAGRIEQDWHDGGWSE